jgi:hypothetical protein
MIVRTATTHHEEGTTTVEDTMDTAVDRTWTRVTLRRLIATPPMPLLPTVVSACMLLELAFTATGTTPTPETTTRVPHRITTRATPAEAAPLTTTKDSTVPTMDRILASVPVMYPATRTTWTVAEWEAATTREETTEGMAVITTVLAEEAWGDTRLTIRPYRILLMLLSPLRQFPCRLTTIIRKIRPQDGGVRGKSRELIAKYMNGTCQLSTMQAGWHGLRVIV